MKTYREYIEELKRKWIGKIVEFESKRYNVVNVDYNGMLLIDKKSTYLPSTAVEIFDVILIK